MPYSKVIFVDSDGTCRSAMIRIIMKSKYLLNPLEIESRGLVVLFSEPLEAKAHAVLEAYGYPVDDTPARQLLQDDIADDVLILTMEDRQKLKIWETFENARHVYTLAEFIHYSGDILPLYGEPVESYEEWVVRMDKLLDELVICLNELSIRDNATAEKQVTQNESAEAMPQEEAAVQAAESERIDMLPEDTAPEDSEDKEDIPDDRKTDGLSDLG